jgi:hypothetical protein
MQGLTEFVNVALELERWQAIRSGLAEWLVWLGIPLWVTAAWPGHLPGGVDRLIVGLWSVVCAIFLYAVATEWKWRRRKARYRVPAAAPKD